MDDSTLFYTRTAKKRILIVDDIRTDLHYMGKLIAGFGHETQLTESASSALELIDKNTDLVIADGIMPGMDGFEFVKSMRMNPLINHIPVIMVTSLSGRQDRIRAVEVGVNDFVTKPVDKVELKVRVDSMLKMKDAQDRVRNYQKELEYLVEKKTFDLNSALIKLQAVLNGMSDCMVTLNDGLDIIEANQAFIRMCRKSADELKGLAFRRLLMGKRQMELFDTLFDPNSAIHECEVDFPQWGRRIFSVVVTPMKNGGHILVMRDITERKKADEQKARFLSILSHELRTPLNGIKGFSEVMLADDTGLSPEYREFTSMINDCGCQLESIVDELLRFIQVFSDKNELEDSHIRVDNVIHRTLDILAEKMMPRQITASVSIHGHDPVIFGKKEHLEEVMIQVIDNAIKFSPSNSCIDIDLSTSSDALHLVVQDLGEGLEEETIDRMFDSFYQAEDYQTRTREGLGLGLTICKKIVESYHGTIHMGNREGGGAKIDIVLPRSN